MENTHDISVLRRFVCTHNHVYAHIAVCFAESQSPPGNHAKRREQIYGFRVECTHIAQLGNAIL